MIMLGRACALALSMAALWLAPHSHAQTVHPGADDNLPLILPPTSLRPPITDAAASTTVIESRMLRQYGLLSVVEALRLVTGSAALRIAGADVRLSLEGTKVPNVTRVNLLIDGVEVYRAAYARLQWPTLPVTLDDVDRLEITRGPHASDASAAPAVITVNIITRHPSDAERGYLSATVGSNVLRNVTARAGLSVGPTSLRVTANYRGNDADEEASRAISPVAGLHVKRLTVRSETRFDEGSTLALDLAYLEGSRNPAAAGAGTNDNIAQEGAAGYISGQWRQSISDLHEIVVVANNWSITPRLLPAAFLRSRSTIELRDTFIVSDQWRLESGAGLQRQRWAGFSRTDPDAHAWAWHAYTGVLARPADWFTLNAAARLDDPTGRGALLSPRVAASFHVAPGHTVRLGWSSGVWMPDGQDPRPITPGALASERIVSVELGYLMSVPAWGVQLDARVYRNRLIDQVVGRGPKGSLTPTLETTGHYAGADVRATADLADGWSGFIAMSTFTRGGEAPIVDRTRRALHGMCAGAAKRLGDGWELGAATYLTSGDAGAHRKTSRVDVTLAKTFLLSGARARFSVMARHLDNSASNLAPSDDDGGGAGATTAQYEDDQLYANLEIGF